MWRLDCRHQVEPDPAEMADTGWRLDLQRVTIFHIAQRPLAVSAARSPGVAHSASTVKFGPLLTGGVWASIPRSALRTRHPMHYSRHVPCGGPNLTDPLPSACHPIAPVADTAIPSAGEGRCKGHRQTFRLSRLRHCSQPAQNRAPAPGQESCEREQSCCRPISKSHSGPSLAKSGEGRLSAATRYSATKRSRGWSFTPARLYAIAAESPGLRVGVDVGAIAVSFE